MVQPERPKHGWEIYRIGPNELKTGADAPVFVLEDNYTYRLTTADYFTIKISGKKAYFDNDGYFKNSENDVVFNLSDVLEIRSVTSHFKLSNGQFWYAMATTGYAVMGQGRCHEL